MYEQLGFVFLMVVEYRLCLSPLSNNALNLELYVRVLILQLV